MANFVFVTSIDTCSQNYNGNRLTDSVGAGGAVNEFSGSKIMLFFKKIVILFRVLLASVSVPTKWVLPLCLFLVTLGILTE